MQVTRRRLLTSLGLGLILMSAPSVVPAAEFAPELVKKAKAHVDVARHAYNLGKFDEALRAYEAAYRLVPRPSLLFNIGQCHRHAQRYREAVFFYDGFLREGDPSPEQREMVDKLREESLAALEADEQRSAAPPAPEVTPREVPALAPPPPPAPPQTAVPAPEVPSTTLTTTPAPVVEAEEGVLDQWWFWVIVGVGVAAAGTGAAIALQPGAAALPSGSAGTVDWR